MPERKNQPSEEAIARRMLFNFALDLYFDPKPWEKKGRGRIYEYLGIKLFKRFQPTGGDFWVQRELKKKGEKVAFERPTYSELLAVERGTRDREAIHLVGFAAMQPLVEIAYAVSPVMGAIFTAANVGINVYPIMLQRYNRTRLYNVMYRPQRSR